jgi:type I restriction enzyme S subunit
VTVRLPDHLDLIATAPDGIQKLRGLILELAVRGKLVPQDPNDEPASELLKRIAKERARLEAEGICKKSKATPFGADEWPFDLPEGWKWCRLPDVANYRMGKTPPTKDSAYWADNGIPWVSISDMVHGERVETTSRTVSDAARERIFRSSPAPAGTLLMSFKLTVGKVATLGMEAFHNEAIISIFPFSGVSQAFLTHFLPMIAQGANSKNALMGDTLNSESLSVLAVPLPPLAEQQRIVAKVDQLMVLCDRLEAEQADAGAAHARLVETLLGTLTQSADAAELAANWQRLAEHFDPLFNTEASLDALKQTILQLAVMGKLVPQDPDDEPASELLKRIAQERAWLEAEGVCKKSMARPPVGEDEQPFAAPDGWMWVRIDDVSQLVTDGEHATPTRTSDRSAIPLVTAKNVRDGYLDYTHTDFVPKDVAEKCWKRCKPTRGDILLVSVGATLGRLSVLDHDRDMVLVRSVTVIRPCLVDRSFFATALRSPIVQDSIWRGVKQSAQPCLYLAQSSSLPIPLPPLAEQHRIVAKVDELLALVDRLKADLAESRARQERLAVTLIGTALAAA